jgi:cystathionine gamma-synthase
MSIKDPSDAELTATLLRLLGGAGEGKSICPSEVSRLLLGEAGPWRSHLKRVRSLATKLAAQGVVVILRHGQPAGDGPVKGVIRLARGPRFGAPRMAPARCIELSCRRYTSENRGPMSRTNRPLSDETDVAQAQHYLDPLTGAVAPPIHPSSTFARREDYELVSQFIYSRYESPTINLAESIICKLEGGAATLLFGTGLAGIAAIFETVQSGEHVVVPRIMYFGALAWLKRLATRKGFTLDQFDQRDISTLRAAVKRGRTKLVWIESPANPTFEVVDIAEAARIAHDAGAILGVDGTNAPPCTTKALAFGADIIFHSATKFLNGHSDITGGAVTVKEKGAHHADMVFTRERGGAVLGAFEAWLLIRGMRTLFVRFERQSENALAVARHFEGHPKLERVIYPGLESHPDHAVALKQMTGGFGGMMSILVKGGSAEARRVAGGCKVFYPATSLGGVESLIEHRKSVEAPDSPVPDNLIRISIGIEKATDLIGDLEQALETV